MPSNYLHLILSHQKLAEINLSSRYRSIFLLGTIAPDAVSSHRNKRKTHYFANVGIALSCRLTAFEKDFSNYRTRSTIHQWFYKGYKYHLLLDNVWLKECYHRAVLRMAIKSLAHRFNSLKIQYYEEMSRFDSFHRSSIEPNVLRDVYNYLTQADFKFFSKFLEWDSLNTMLERLSEEMQRVELSFKGHLLQAGDIERFLRRASRVPID